MSRREDVNVHIRTTVDQSGVRILETALRRMIGLGSTVQRTGQPPAAPPPMPSFGQRMASAAAAGAFAYGTPAQRAAQVAYQGFGGEAGGVRSFAGAAGAYGAVRAGQAVFGGASNVGQRTEAAGQKFISTALGSSVEGFLFQSAETWMRLDNTAAQLERRFRSAKGSVMSFGLGLSYTRAQAAQLAETLGGETDSVSKGQFTRYAGFARDRGMDAGQTMKLLGSLERLSGRQVSDGFLMNVAGRANARGMGEGRLGEYIQLLSAQAENSMQATGGVNMGRVAAINDLPGLVFGANDPRGQGAMGAQLLSGIHGTLTGSPQVQNFLMRSMGFGQQGGPGYIDMRKRLEAGIYDPRNLQDLFGEMQGRGMSRGGMFRALESVSGGQLKAWQIEGLVDKFGSKEGLAGLRAATEQGAGKAYVDDLLATMSPEDQTRAKLGYSEVGKGKAGMGAARDVEIESMQMEVGEDIANFMASSREVIRDVASAWQKIFGENPGKLLTKVGEELEKASENFKDMIPEGGWREIGSMMAEGFAQSEFWNNVALGARFVAAPVQTTVEEVSKRSSVAGSGAE